jgi:serine/threonine-protein kinase
MPPQDNQPKERVIGRYALYGEIAAGGMATVHFGRMLGAVGFSRTVAIKRLHEQFAKDPDFVSMFLDEARLAARIQHPNVVSSLDVVGLDGELFLVMEYIKGESLSRLLRTARRNGEVIPPRIVATIVSGLLNGLHAAHEATDEQGEPLGIVHRDVSPQNVLVGTDGVSRVLDFGVAKAAGRLTTTREGQLKGKFAYMSPEQVRGINIDRRTDIFAAAVVLWEAMTGHRMIEGESEAVVLSKVLDAKWTKPSEVLPTLPKSIDVVTMRGLDPDPNKRYSTAKEMAFALERAVGLASQREVGEWVERAAVDALASRAMRIKEIESRSVVKTHAEIQGSVAELMTHSSIRPGPPTDDDATQFWTGKSTASGVSVVGSTAGVPGQGETNATASMPTNVTSFSATTAGAPPQDNRRGLNVAIIAMAGAMLIFAGVAAAALVILAKDRSAPAGQGVAPVVSVTAPSATAAAATAPATTAPTAATDHPPASATGAPSTAPAATTATAATATAVKTAAKGGSPAAPTKTAAPPKGDCDVPYTIDAQGIKRPKPQCFL